MSADCLELVMETWSRPDPSTGLVEKYDFSRPTNNFFVRRRFHRPKQRFCRLAVRVDPSSENR